MRKSPAEVAEERAVMLIRACCQKECSVGMMMRQIEVEDLIEGAVQEGALFTFADSPAGHLVVPSTNELL